LKIGDIVFTPVLWHCRLANRQGMGTQPAKESTAAVCKAL